jgi:hypothetical protein
VKFKRVIQHMGQVFKIRHGPRHPAAKDFMNLHSIEALKLETVQRVRNSGIPVIYADEMLVDFMDNGDKDGLNIRDKVLESRNVLPPFEECWFEYQGIPSGFDSPVTLACHMKATSDMVKFWGPSDPDDELTSVLRECKPGLPRFVMADVYVGPNQSNPNECVGPIGRVHYIVDDEYRVMRDPQDENVPVMVDAPIIALDYVSEHHDETDTTRHVLNLTGGVLIHTISVMNAANIITEDEGLVSDGIGRKTRERENTPTNTYRVLKIKKQGKKAQRLPQIGSGDEKRLHIVRGHFKHYGEDGRGLFLGKYKRTIYCPYHLRGNPERGVSDHDYRVESP